MVHYSLILICNNQWNLTEQAIRTLNESIRPYHKQRGVEFIVINNGSQDETKVRLEELKERLKQEIEIVPIHLTENMGWLIGTNIGLSKARGQIVTLLNNDLIFPENWFDGIVRTLEENPSVGAAAPFLSYAMAPAGVGVAFDSLQEIQDFSKKFIEDNKDKIVYTERINGGCLSFKRELFSRIGGNDYWFGIGWGEDVDWSLRACIAGYKIAVVGASFVYHIGSKTAFQYPEFLTAALKANNDKLIKKWDLNSGRDQKQIIRDTAFSKYQHTFPCRIEDFNPPSAFRNPVKASKKKMILVADWNNECSKWRNALADAKTTLNENLPFTIWIPKTYNPEEKIEAEVRTLLGPNLTSIQFCFDDVPPIDLLNFLSHYNVFLTVKDDFVNRYFKYLIEQSGLNITVDR